MRRFKKFSSTQATARIAWLCAAGVWMPARAQEPLAPPAPLRHAISAPPAGATVVAFAAAQRAQDLGLPSIAAETYRQLLDAPGADRAGLTLAWITALLDAGRAAEAEKLLAALPGPHGAAWHLRSGLVALQARKRDAAQAEWDAIKADEVVLADRAWYWFLTGALYDTAAVRDVTKANGFYLMAEAAATTDLARARFQLAGEQVRLWLFGKPSEAGLRQTRETYERNLGRAVGYDAAKSHAVMLAESGRRAEGVTFLQRVLATVPAQERDMRDELRFVLGMIGDRARNGPGRNALNQLLENGQNIVRQRQALQLLTAASSEEPARGLFLADLTRLIASKPPHPILESLLFYRAQLSLADKMFARAEEDAGALLKQFPLSPLRVHALGVLLQSAWEQHRYRQAATYAQTARMDLAALAIPAATTAAGAADTASAGVIVIPIQPPSPPAPPGLLSARARTDLAVLEAEARFRAGDFPAAADAYAAVLRERSPELEPRRIGELMFQRVLAEIKAGSGEAGRVLDELERDPAFDLENRWQAEWSLARALQLQGTAGIKEAYARVNALLLEPAPGAATLPPELRARMAWLQAKLSFESGDPAHAIELVEKLLGTAFEVEAGLKAEIASIALLLKARAEFGLGREPVALETLKRLRADFPDTDAAISSYLIEAEHFAAQDKIDEARNQLIKLTDNEKYRSSEYVPLALYRLALLSERLGREENLREANQRIEDLVTSKAAVVDPGLIFAARLRQGDIFRKLNDFARAQHAYEDLVHKYSHRPDVVLAQLALAECHNAQSSPTDPSHAEAAQLIFEQLRDRVDAPRDVRVEAGYSLGALLARRGKTDEAAKVWWHDVIDPFLRQETKPMEEDAKRPYWLARTLLELGDLSAKQGRLEEAKSAFALILEKRLPYGETVARARLEQLGVSAAKPSP